MKSLISMSNENLAWLMFIAVIITILLTFCTIGILCNCGVLTVVTDMSINNTDAVVTDNNSAETDEHDARYTAVLNWQSSAGDFREEQYNFLYEQCEKYEIPVEVMLALICTESSFRSYAQAGTSTATGYCQITVGTAEWVYESLLKYGQYDTANHINIMKTDWRLNITMSCRLMYCLYWNYGESWSNAIRRYYGSTDTENDRYLEIVNGHMYDLFGMTTSDFN